MIKAIEQCTKIKLKPCPTYLKQISHFSPDDINKAKIDVNKYNYLNHDIKGIWTLMGLNQNKWLCLEVGSSYDIKSEIKSALGCMESTINRVYKDSEFYKGAKLFPFLEFSDKASCKYRAVKEFFREFIWFEIDPYKYVDSIGIRKKHEEKNIVQIENEEVGIINFVEVHFAFTHKALLWNPAPQTNGNKEKVVLSILNKIV